jgi:two-component system LytT family response regulator
MTQPASEPTERFNFLVVDDEKNSRSLIRSMIEDFRPGANVREASSAQEALAIIGIGGLDAVFLDVKMPGMNGFEMLDVINNRDFELVFVTAYSQFAINAIREGATDYLLKPIKITEFKHALNSVIEKRQKKLKERLSTAVTEDRRMQQQLQINSKQGIKFVVLKDIICLEADNSYTTLHLADGKKVTTSRPINQFEKSLDPDLFFRVHKSNIINRYHFKEYLIKRGGRYALMCDGTAVGISRQRLRAFLNFIGFVNKKVS